MIQIPVNDCVPPHGIKEGKYYLPFLSNFINGNRANFAVFNLDKNSNKLVFESVVSLEIGKEIEFYIDSGIEALPCTVEKAINELKAYTFTDTLAYFEKKGYAIEKPDIISAHKTD